MNKNEMPVLDKNERIKNFKEVSLGYDDALALEEAKRCLNCKNPRCVSGCPVNIQIPKFIEKIKEGNIGEAYKIISESSLLPGICGRVCPQEKQCEKMCIKGFKGDAISIGSLERYVADWAFNNNIYVGNVDKKNNKKIAVVGSGPSGLTCASELAKRGYSVTIYEALHKAGGVLTYGIPEFRLPKRIVENEIETLKKMGVNIILNAVVGSSILLSELEQEYDAVYIATGAGLPKFMGIPNEDANGVFSANEVLTRVNLMKAYEKDYQTPIKIGEKVAVIGGGNVAMDAARSIRRFGSEVHLIYRRSEAELPARRAEVEHALEEGIIFDYLTNPVKVNVDDDNNVKSLELIKMELTEELEAGRKNVTEIKDSNYIFDCDMIVMALGTTVNTIVNSENYLEIDKFGHIITDETKTNKKGFFAGGDVVTGSATVILAMEAGKKAAAEIIEFLTC